MPLKGKFGIRAQKRCLLPLLRYNHMQKWDAYICKILGEANACIGCDIRSLFCSYFLLEAIMNMSFKSTKIEIN